MREDDPCDEINRYWMWTLWESMVRERGGEKALQNFRYATMNAQYGRMGFPVMLEDNDHGG